MQARPRPSLDTSITVFAPHSAANSPSGSPTVVLPLNGLQQLGSALSTPADATSPDAFHSPREFYYPSHSPSSSLPSLTNRTDSEPPEPKKEEYAITKYDYQPDDCNLYLPFKAGQTISVIEKNPNGWYFGECCQRRGWFPSNYILHQRSIRARSNSGDSVSLISSLYVISMALGSPLIAWSKRAPTRAY